MARRVFVTLSLFSALIYTSVHGGLEQQTETNTQMLESNDFAFRLYKSIRAQSDSQNNNVFFSPLSVSMALAALSLGAGGETHRQLFSGLGFNSSVFTSEEVHKAFFNLLQALNQRKGVDLDVGTALFVQDTFKPHPEFLEKMKRFYLSDGFSIDFAKTKETTEQINKYVNEKTHGKITKFTEDVDPSTLMYLLSYVYFKGAWSLPFDLKLTEPAVFHVDNETTVTVEMMHQVDFFDAYFDPDLSTQVLCLHYSDSLSMMLALPNQGLADLEEAVSLGHIIKWLKWMKKRRFEIYVPKLSLKQTYSLKDILTGMGMMDMFTREADFTGISSEENLFVSEAVHQASLDMDEAGATATGVTDIRIVPLAWSLTTVLRFNRPFMIFIIDKQTKSVLFMGKIINPAKKM